MDLKKLMQDCCEMKLKALEMASTSSFGVHIGGAFSAMEIFTALYAVANIPSTIESERDRIIVSKGHCVLAYFTALWKKGFLSEEELKTFETDGSIFYGHPNRNLKYGIEFSAGSLGLGISYAVGVAKACQLNHYNNRIFVLLGDGELNEGIVWETLMSITNYSLNNITIIIDKNDYQLDGKTVEVMNMNDLKGKFESFGFDTKIVDGHSIESLTEAFSLPSNVPNVVIAKTTKANGISFLMNTKQSHFCTLSGKKYNQAVQDIKTIYYE